MIKKIMWCSDSTTLPTGYANQTDYILRHLAQYYDSYLFGHQTVGNVERRWNYTLLPGGLTPNAYGKDQINHFISRVKPDLITWLCDAFMINWVKERKTGVCERCSGSIREQERWDKINPGMKTMFYFPFDSEEVYAGAEEVLKNMDYRIAMSKFGQQLLKDSCGLESDYIPHCVDTNIFFPINEEEKEKLKEANGLAGKFVIGMNGRNQTRKLPSRLLYIFKEFLETHPDSVLLMNTDPYDPMGNNLVEIGKKLGIEKNVVYTGMTWYSGHPINVLNSVYNTMDVHCMTTTGEGFGITTLEAMSCGIPNVITDYTTTKELLIEDGECGIPVPWSDFVSGGYNTRRVLADKGKFLDGLCELYNSQDKRKKMGEIGRKKAIEKYSTNVVLPMWKRKIEEVLGE